MGFHWCSFSHLCTLSFGFVEAPSSGWRWTDDVFFFWWMGKLIGSHRRWLCRSLTKTLSMAGVMIMVIVMTRRGRRKEKLAIDIAILLWTDEEFAARGGGKCRWSDLVRVLNKRIKCNFINGHLYYNGHRFIRLCLPAGCCSPIENDESVIELHSHSCGHQSIHMESVHNPQC